MVQNHAGVRAMLTSLLISEYNRQVSAEARLTPLQGGFLASPGRQ